MTAKKIVALMLAVFMIVSCMSACSSSTSSNSGTAESGTTADSSTAEESTGSDDTSSTTTATTVKGEENCQEYPLTTEEITLDYWYPQGSSMAELADFNDSYFWQWYEEKTGVHINFIVPAAGTEADAFQLLFASDDMPDIIYVNAGSYEYRDGQDAAIDDGYFLNIDEYLDYAPNYKSWLDNDEDFRRAAYSDTGLLYGFWGIWVGTSDSDDENDYADYGISIRQDFLDEVGLDAPTTYSEWETVLTAFKDELGIEAPLYTSKYGVDTGEFMAGYGVAPYFYQVDGEVKYGPMEDGYLEYLTMMNDWYNKGLLDHDFATRQSSGVTADNDMILNDKVGALIDYGTRLGDAYISRGATNTDLLYVAVQQPTKDTDDPDYIEPEYRNITSCDGLYGACQLISADCEYIELACRWIDGFYAEDVALNANYGTEEYEGTVWTTDESTSTGRLIDYDFRYNNPDGLSSGMVLVQYAAKNPPLRYEGMQSETGPEERVEGYKTWKTFGTDNVIPSRVTMTADEGSEYASMYTDIETYVQECNIKFIMGQMSLDDYDTYRETLKSMGIEECIAIQQAALDRYNAR